MLSILYDNLRVSVAQFDERPIRDQKDTGSLLRLGLSFLAHTAYLKIDAPVC